MMDTVTSKDGTVLAYERLGRGQPVILIGGALQHRALDRVIGKRSEVLAECFDLVHYDRRGRGDSGDIRPYAVEKEIEDLEAMIEVAGGLACVLGLSSGGALALQAAVSLKSKMRMLAVYEVPHNDEPAARVSYAKFVVQLDKLLAANRRNDALALFMTHFEAPCEQIEALRGSSLWPLMESVAPTLVYDMAVLGLDNSIPVDKVCKVNVPTLILDGGASFPFIQATATALASQIPGAQRRTLAGQTHAVDAEVLASALVHFFDTSL